MTRASPAPGDPYVLRRMPQVTWQVVSCLQEIGADYETVEWVRLYDHDQGTVMVRLGDPTEILHTPMRPINQALLPCR